MGYSNWFKFSKAKLITLIILIFLFISLTIVELTIYDFGDFMASFAAGFAIIMFLLIHLLTSLKKRKIVNEIIKFRKSILEFYSKINSFNTKWGIINFGDKLDIKLNNGNTITGYLSNINDSLEIVNKEGKIDCIHEVQISSIINNSLSSLLSEPVKNIKVREVRTSFSVDSRRIKTTWIKYYSLFDSLSINIEECIKNRDFEFLNDIKKIWKKLSSTI